MNIENINDIKSKLPNYDTNIVFKRELYFNCIFFGTPVRILKNTPYYYKAFIPHLVTPHIKVILISLNCEVSISLGMFDDENNIPVEYESWSRKMKIKKLCYQI